MSTIIGKVISIGEVKSGVSATTGNKWSRCQFVVEVLNTNQKLTLQTYRESIINELRTGMVREFDFDFNAREYQGKWYDQHDLTSMRTINLGTDGTGNSNNGAVSSGTTAEPKPAAVPEGKVNDAPKDDKGLQEKTDDLPF